MDRHHHHHRRDEEEERREQPPLQYPPPADPYGRQFGGDYQRPPPPYQQGGYDSGPAYPPPVQHVAHEVGPGPYPYGVGGASHERRGGGPHAAVGNPKTVRVVTKAGGDGYSLSVRNGKVILTRSDANDEFQHWIKEEKFSTQVKDEEGLPSFALVNKVTGEAIKHSIGATHPVRLVPYNPDYLDESVLWTESYDTGENYRCIRMVNNIRLNFDAFNGDKDHGGVHDGTTVVLWEWAKGENQRWKIIPY